MSSHKKKLSKSFRPNIIPLAEESDPAAATPHRPQYIDTYAVDCGEAVSGLIYLRQSV